MAGRRGAAAITLVVVLVLGAIGFVPGPAPSASAAPGSLVLQGKAVLGNGVDHLRYATASPKNVIHVARIKAGAPVSVRPVLSRDRVLGDTASSGLETTTSMCHRAGALACVNGDFATCPACTAPLGGVIRNGEVLRSPNPAWPQLWVGPAGMGGGSLGLSGEVVATYRPPGAPALPTATKGAGVTGGAAAGSPPTPPSGAVPPVGPEGANAASAAARQRSVTLALTGVNVGRTTRALVLYTPAYAASTRTVAGGFEVAVTASSRAALDRSITLTLGAGGTGGNTRIPSNGFVLSAAAGPAADQLRAFWSEARRIPDQLASVTLALRTSTPVGQSLGGHPILLRAGTPLPPPDPADTASRVRHPRTLVGWNAAGDIWLVTIDGRQPGRSVGATFWEAADVLRRLGATDGINLDGGGSTTFVAKRCAGALCVRNSPSDGRERAVTTALAIVPRR